MQMYQLSTTIKAFGKFNLIVWLGGSENYFDFGEYKQN